MHEELRVESGNWKRDVVAMPVVNDAILNHTKTVRLRSPELARQLVVHLGPTLVAGRWPVCVTASFLISGPARAAPPRGQRRCSGSRWRIGRGSRWLAPKVRTLRGPGSSAPTRAWARLPPMWRFVRWQVNKVMATAAAFVDGSDD